MMKEEELSMKNTIKLLKLQRQKMPLLRLKEMSKPPNLMLKLLQLKLLRKPHKMLLIRLTMKRKEFMLKRKN